MTLVPSVFWVVADMVVLKIAGKRAGVQVPKVQWGPVLLEDMAKDDGATD